jgi:hypothetical protein
VQTDADLAAAGRRELDVLDPQRVAERVEDGGAHAADLMRAQPQALAEEVR